MFDKILLPLDGSELAEIAIPYAEEFARVMGSEILLYHVRRHEHADQEHMHQMYLNRLAETVELNVAKDDKERTPVKVTTIVEGGEPSENICRLVQKNEIGVIVMSAASASGLKVGRMLGSVTDHICRTIPVPVLLIRPQNVRRMGEKDRLINRLLIPLDGSDLGRLALPVGEELAARLKASISLFQMSRVVLPYDDPPGSAAYAQYARFNQEEEARVRAEMSVLEKDVRGRGLDVDSMVTSGVDAAGEIIQAEKTSGADLVVMSTHGRSGPTRWVLGNVAERVLRHGEIPLLLVHARAD